MEVSIRNNIREVMRSLSSIEKKQVPFAASQAINDVAYGLARKQLPGEMDATFQGGATPYTKRAFKFTKSSKRDLRARVYSEYPYMKLMVHGGQRLPKGRSIFIASDNIKRNKYGNVTRGKMQKMITDDKKYFSRDDKMYERYGRNGSKTRLAGVYKQSLTYRKTLPLQKIGENYVRSRGVGFPARFNERLAQALRTQRR